MKKTIFFLIALIFLGLSSIQAQDLMVVSGVVSNELNGDPVVNHDVSIMLNDSSFFNSTVVTDQTGFYMDTIFIGGGVVISIYIMTNDLCTYGIHDTLIQNPALQVYANFEICVDSVTNPECQADFYYVPDSSNNLTVNFFDQSTSTLTINSWTWDFGDGNTSTVQDPVHNYANAGTYNVCLSIESSDFGVMCTDTYCMDVIVQSGGGNDCMADFYYIIDSTGGNYTIVNFYDLSTPVGLIESWYWDFDDGTTSTEQHPVHTYNSSGVYNVCLSITANPISCTSVYCDSIFVNYNNQLQLGGNVFAGIYQLDHGFAYAYKSEGGVIIDVFSEMIDTLGYYLFYPMVAADYYVKAEPSPSSAFIGTHIPTYYGDVAYWEDAVMINLTQNVYTADINLIPMMMNVSGPGSIAGIIEYEGGNKGNTPAVGIQIMLANEQGEYVGLVYSDDEGKFEFTTLPYGTFTIFADVMGIKMTPNEYFITEENAVIDDISMIITDDEIYFGPDGIKSIYIDNVSNVYPNPISNKLKLDIGIINPTMISVKIYNQMGQALIMEQFNVSNTQTIEVNTSGLKSGLYFLEIIADDNYRIARKFIKQ